MSTENEKRALQLAKRVFEHFTRETLSIAKEILVLEQEIDGFPAGPAPSIVSQSLTEGSQKQQSQFYPLDDVQTPSADDTQIYPGVSDSNQNPDSDLPF